jgi:hypothetical protein
MKENIIILDFLMKQHIDDKKSLFALFLDFKKAFERVDHDFLLKA